MILTLLSHQWKSFWRSRSAGKTLILRLLVGFVLLYLLVTSFVLGFTTKPILLYFFPGQDPAAIFCSLPLYYFTLDLAFRLQLQGLPVLATRPYLLQNIPRRRLINFLNIRSLFHYFNLLPLCIFFPFIFTDIRAAYGNVPALALAGSVILLILINHFLILYIKRKSVFNAWWLAAFVAANILLILFAPLRKASSAICFDILHTPWHALTLILPLVLVYLVNRRYLFGNLYFEELTGQDKYRQSTEYSWLTRWGAVGELLGLEWRLILRNRRPRAFLLIGIAGLAYGIVFNRPLDGHPVSLGMLFFICTVVNSTFLIKYGTPAFAWQSAHFDGLLSSNIQARDYIRSKFYAFTAIATIAYIISLFYGLLDRRMLPMLTVAWLYNIGCNIPVIAWCATFCYEPIDLGKGMGFNYKPMSTASTFYITLIMAPPFCVYLLFARLFNPWTGIFAIGVMGIAGILFRPWLVKLVVKEFFQRKYLILQGFREK